MKGVYSENLIRRALAYFKGDINTAMDQILGGSFTEDPNQSPENLKVPQSSQGDRSNSNQRR
jgi:hypothetical protein